MIIPAKDCQYKNAQGIIIQFCLTEVSAFADNVEATLVTRNKYPTPTVAANCHPNNQQINQKAGCFSLKSPTLPVNNANC